MRGRTIVTGEKRRRAAVAVVETERQGDVAIIRMDNPPVNALGHALRLGLEKAFAEANADAAVKAIVLTGTGRFFSAGADITEFKSEMKEPGLPTLIDKIEAGTKPVVAAINGTALGGGLELALGCHYRVAGKDVRQLGLPEIKLGIIPGAGGTQRLPRAVGVEQALQMITTGAFIDAKKGAAAGLIDKVADGDVIVAAVAFAKEQVGKPARRIGEKKIDKGSVPAGLFEKARGSLARHSSGPVAPKAAIDAVEASANLPLAEGNARERQLFRDAAASPYARALQYAFFAERQAANLPGIGPDSKLRNVDTVGIVGAGTMGTGIGLAFLNGGFPVTIVETTQEALDRGVARVKDTLDANVKRGRITEAQAADRFAKLTPSLNLEDLGKTDLIIEAVFENLALKKEVFQKLDRIAKSGAILASNTSTLDVDQIAAATKRAGDVVGTHFFSPANVMRLLEVVRGRETAKDVLATTMKLGKRLKKLPVVSGVCDGFIGNRMLEKYTQQAYFLLDEGASPEQVDGALQRWGMAMGPFTMYDMAGNDIGWEIRKRRYRERPDFVYSRVADRVCELGRFGQKTGKGFYRYEPGSRKPLPDPEVQDIIEKYRAEIGVKPRQISDEEIVQRCAYALANEGARILEEGIALRASDIDMVYLTGYGFPPYRGGPMFYADSVGLPKVLDAMRGFQKGYQGAQWKPAPLLVRLAEAGKRFNE
jgi:3-hydroxyacyl-CoA dehydrogenase